MPCFCLFSFVVIRAGWQGIRRRSCNSWVLNTLRSWLVGRWPAGQMKTSGGFWGWEPESQNDKGGSVGVTRDVRQEAGNWRTEPLWTAAEHSVLYTKPLAGWGWSMAPVMLAKLCALVQDLVFQKKSTHGLPNWGCGAAFIQRECLSTFCRSQE